jgi:hypothetical protein
MFEIASDPSTGVHCAIDAQFGRRVTVLPDGETRMFRRRAIKQHSDGRIEEVHWLVAELDGVRAYIEGGDVVMTRQELYP